MIFSLSTLTTGILTSSVLLILFLLVYRKPTGAQKLGIYAPIVFAGALALRLLLPFEWRFTLTIPLPGLYSQILDFLNWPLFYWGALPFTVSHVFVMMVLPVFAVKLIALFIPQFSYGRYLCSLPTRSMVEYPTAWGGKRHVRCVVDTASSNALAFGLFHPTIVLPSLSLSQSEHDLIVRHELTHIQNGDLWIKYAIEIICQFFWWNPLFGLLSIQVSYALETRVDRQVTQDLSEGQKIIYVECLLKMAKLNLTRTHALSPYLTSGKDSALLRRFELILNSSGKTPTISRVFVLVLLIATIGSACVVLEPSYMPEEIKAATFGDSDVANSHSYLVKRTDGGYDLYMDGQCIGKVQDASTFEDLPIYNTIQEVSP